MITLDNVELNEKDKDRDYGGAYDIDPQQYFIKEDLLELADAVIEKLNDKYTYSFDIADIYIDEDDSLYIELSVDNDFTIYTYVNIDMRRIKKPSDIQKYMPEIIEDFTHQLEEINELNSYTEEINELNSYNFNKESISTNINIDTHQNLKLNEQTLRLGNPWKHWTDVYKIFGLISEMNKGKLDVIKNKVNEFYNMFKGIKEVDTAYQRWNSKDT